MVKVVPYTEGERAPSGRLGFMAGEVAVPEDFDRMGAAEIETLFDGSDS